MCMSAAAIIDRTAEFVRRVGPQFEGEIMQRNKCVQHRQTARQPCAAHCRRRRLRLRSR